MFLYVLETVTHLWHCCSVLAASLIQTEYFSHSLEKNENNKEGFNSVQARLTFFLAAQSQSEGTVCSTSSSLL